MFAEYQNLARLFETHLQQSYQVNEPQNLYVPIAHILNLKGKRIRPIISLFTSQLLGQKINEDVLNVATAIELFHNFTLIHDDIIDASNFRRGEPTVHEKYGINAGILSGDALMILAYQQLQKLPAKYFPHILETFNAIAIGICEGQQLDIDFETQSDVSLTDYFKMISLKTSILIGLSFQISALLAGVTKADEEHFFNIGKNIGIAYQIQDDYLDVFGKFESFGKPIGNDIWLNKKTYLSILAKELCNPEQKIILENVSQEKDKRKKIKTTQNLFLDLKINIQTQACVQKYSDNILHSLKALSCLGENEKQQILNLSQTLIFRKQ